MKLAIFLVLLAVPAPLAACTFANIHSFPFSSTYPSELKNEPLVARVRILHDAQPISPIKMDSFKQSYDTIGTGIQLPKVSFSVEVTENFRGSKIGDLFDVVTTVSSCYGMAHVSVGTEWYIAGKLHNGIFFGTWSVF